MTSDKIILNKIAHQILPTWKPSTRLAASKMSKPFIIKVNRPRVRMFSGNVRRMNMGFIAILISDKIKPANIAVGKSKIITPGKI